ncbi:MAG: response regulator, partial [Betaproteobacteria bacterium]|nr:response regulator [Betaproteobacteria bacterium]
GGEQIAIIALTASALLDQQDQALDAGMDAFLTKPVRPGVLCEAVQTHVSAQRAHRLPQAARTVAAANDVQIENA